MHPPFLRSDRIAAPHGFFGRRGGVSAGPYASLNCSLSGGDAAPLVARNRALAAAALPATPERLLGVRQVHGRDVVRIETVWPPGQGPAADAMVTDRAGIALGIITADCAPVLLHDPLARVVGAAHAGWRGAVAGVLQATVAEMVALGAAPGNIHAAIGPCIAPESYEVGEDLRAAVLPTLPDADHLFAPGRRAGHWQFDLPGYCAALLAAAGVAAAVIGEDTASQEDRYFSHRRRTLAGGGAIGHQISLIMVPG
jgi:YfiH family protein